MKSIIRRKPYLIPLFVLLGIGGIALFGWIVMLLWNAVLVPAAGASLITFWQALGLLVLSRILVGGFGGGGGRNNRSKWNQMSPEEKEKFKQYCRNKWGKDKPEETTVTEMQ